MVYLCFGVELYIWILEVDYNIFRFHFGVTLVFLKWYNGQKKCLNEVTAVYHPVSISSVVAMTMLQLLKAV